jgi:hypothetical protein
MPSIVLPEDEDNDDKHRDSNGVIPECPFPDMTGVKPDHDGIEDVDEYPVIRVYGHGWDPSNNNSELSHPSYKKVSSVNLDVAWISALTNRVPYIECEGDDVSKNVELLDCQCVPNMVISISDFKDEPPHNYKFGIYELYSDGSEGYINYWWLEELGQCSVFTLKELVRELNVYYPDGYNLELHMGRQPLMEFDGLRLPNYVQYSDMVNELMYEYSLEHPSFLYLPRIQETHDNVESELSQKINDLSVYEGNWHKYLIPEYEWDYFEDNTVSLK